MSDNNSDFGAFLAGFVIGGLVGAATALILAPQSGQEMRGQINNKSQEWRQASSDRINQYRGLADSYTHEYRERAELAMTDARQRVATTSEHLQEQARIILEPGRKELTTPEATAGSDNEATASD
jgi:gas vesicle protein